ncbi:hypothetical protein PAXRUDRAFT_158105, partial [Paxillus rubicundulus Ve08.2h10]
IYRKCQKVMVALQADETLLRGCELLIDQDIKVTTASSNPNWSVHFMADLTWFLIMDIHRDTQKSDYMSECRLYIYSK